MLKFYAAGGVILLVIITIAALNYRNMKLKNENLELKNELTEIQNELSNSQKALTQEKRSFAAMKSARENCVEALDSKEKDYQSLNDALEKKERQRDSLNKALNKERAKICEQGETTCPEYEDLRDEVNKINGEWNR